MQQNTSKYWYYCVCIVAELLQVVAFVAETVAETVADTFHLLQKLLQVVASSIYCKLQQSATSNFYHFFRFCNRKTCNKCNKCNSFCNTYLFINIVYLYICNSFCNNSSLISLQIAIYICFLFLRFSLFFVRSYTHLQFLCGKF